jgi:hypothetical protein
MARKENHGLLFSSSGTDRQVRRMGIDNDYDMY